MQAIDWTAYGLAVLLARRQRKLKQTDLARMLGVSRATLSYIEHGSAHPRWKTIDAIATLLDVRLVGKEET